MTMNSERPSLRQEANVSDRRMRNFLLDGRFQLKYTGMVLVAALIVASVLGGVAYQFSRGQTEALAAQVAGDPELSPELAEELNSFAEQEDRKVLLMIIAGIVMIALIIALAGLVLTHRVVGPAYRLKRLFDTVADGRLHVDAGLRRKDELQDVYQRFSRMVESLRRMQAADLAALDEALRNARARGMDSEAIREFEAVAEHLRARLRD